MACLMLISVDKTWNRFISNWPLFRGRSVQLEFFVPAKSKTRRFRFISLIIWALIVLDIPQRKIWEYSNLFRTKESNSKKQETMIPPRYVLTTTSYFTLFSLAIYLWVRKLEGACRAQQLCTYVHRLICNWAVGRVINAHKNRHSGSGLSSAPLVPPVALLNACY